MTKTTTIQISVYNWSLMEELVYEAQIGSVEEFLALTYRFEKKVKFKKPTDKNWYYAKTMIKRLFKKEVEKNTTIKFVTANDLDKLLEERQKAKEMREQKEFEEERMLMGWGPRETNPKLGVEQIKAMSESELAKRLTDLYVEDYYISKTDYNSYDGLFNCHLTEIAYIELQVSSGVADRAYHHALEALCGGELTFKPDRLPKSEIFRLTNDYKLEYIGRA